MKKWLCLLLCLLLTGAAAETLPDQGLSFLTDAGIAADSVVMVGSELIVTLADGGTAALYTYGDFDPFDMSWRFVGASDGDVALYLDHCLSMLHALEQRIPDSTEGLSAAEAMRARDCGVMVSNSLLALEHTGDQGLRVLLDALSAREDTPLNSLRARLASRLLGFLDATPVDPAMGLAWYDALTISVQDALPAVDAALYEPDPLLAAASELLIALEEERRAEGVWPQVEAARARNLVVLRPAKVVETADSATIWGMMYSAQLALYDGTRLRLVSGWIPPVRVELTKSGGGWTLAAVTCAEDGEDYAPSILRFCDGDKALQKAVMTLEIPDMEAAARTWLAAIGYPQAAME